MRRAVLLCVMAACSSSAPVPVTTQTSTPPTPSHGLSARSPHIVVVVMENHSYSQIIGSRDAPYLNSLATRYGLATNYHAVAHPSLPNYLAMAYGDTFGITSDCTSCSARGPSVGDQLDAAGISWKAFFEGLPSPCFGGAYWGDYAKKHNPFAYFVPSQARCRQHMVPLTQLDPADLPSFSFIVPNLCHDMHDCSVATGDAWLLETLPPLVYALSGTDALVVTFDEDNGSEGNHVATIVVSPAIKAGTRVDVHLTHYSLLRGVEDAFALPALRHAADAPNLLRAAGV